MKKGLFYVLVLACVALLSSCDYLDPEPDYGPHFLFVVKFTNPQYKNNVIASFSDNHYCIGSGSINGPWISMPSKIPYYDLGEDYLLVDWRLSSFYFTSGSLLSASWSKNTPSRKWSKKYVICDSREVIESYWKIPYAIYIAYTEGKEEASFDDEISRFNISKSSSLSNQQESIHFYDERYAKICEQLQAIVQNEGLPQAIDSMKRKYKDYIQFNYYCIDPLNP